MSVFDLWTATNDMFYANAERNNNKKSFAIADYLHNHFNAPALDDPLSRAMNFDTSSAKGQFDAQRYDNYNATQIRVQDALRAGVNPSAVIGGSVGHASPTISAGGDGYKQPSYGFGSQIAGIAREFMEMEKDSKELDLESKRLQNDLLREKLAVATQPGVPIAGQAANPNWRIPMNLKYRDAKPLYKSWYTDDGELVRLLDPDAIADADYSNMEALKAYGTGARGYFTENTFLGDIRKWLDKRARKTKKYWLYGKPKRF